MNTASPESSGAYLGHIFDFCSHGHAPARRLQRASLERLVLGGEPDVLVVEVFPEVQRCPDFCKSSVADCRERLQRKILRILGRPFEAVRADYRVSRRDECISTGRERPGSSPRGPGVVLELFSEADVLLENLPE